MSMQLPSSGTTGTTLPTSQTSSSSGLPDRKAFYTPSDIDAAAAGALESERAAAVSVTAAAAEATRSETARTGSETARTGAETARAAAESARAGAQTARAAAEAARDSAVNSFVGTDIQSGVSADSLTSPGVYRGLPGRVSLAAGFPVASGAGVLEVLHVGTGSVVQRFTVQADAGTGRGHYVRTRYGGNWQPWRYVASQRVDQTAGRAIYTWDDLNGREQLIYGDTGTRNITALLLNGWLGDAFIRRVGAVVHLKLLNVRAGSGRVLDSLAGFRNPGAQGWHPTGQGGGILREQNGGIELLNTASSVYANFTWLTEETWPSVLPGTANGVVPQ